MSDPLYRLQLYAYRAAGLLAVALLTILRPFLPAKLRRMVEVRRRDTLPLIADRPVWIHAASGEIEYAKPVIRELRARFPATPLVVSYFSPSAERLLPPEEPMVKFFPMPWDTRGRMRHALDVLKPVAVLFARTDAWPELVAQCRARGVPTLLFATTLAENSSKKNFFGRPLVRGTLARLTAIHAVSDEDARQLRAIGVREAVYVTGDTRFDQVFHRLEHPRLQLEKPEWLAGHPVFVAGSTWPEDEAVLVPALREFLAVGGRALFAPHEATPAHLDRLRARWREAGVATMLLSELALGDRAPVILVDTVGILADLYAWGNCAFVGGSFRAKIHSVMEPLAAGLPVAVGPYHRNNREAIAFQDEALGGLRMVTAVRDAGELAAWLKTAVAADGPAIRAKTRTFGGATSRVGDFVRFKIPRA